MHPATFSGRWCSLASVLAVFGVFSLWLTVAADAESPATEFSATNNPNGVWSYGDSLTFGSPLLLYTLPINLVGLVGWNDGPTSNNPPQILYNGTDGEINFATLSLEPGEILLHPGPNGEVSLLRFTAPTTGFYRATGSFFGRDHSGTTTDVHLLANGTSVFDGAVNGYGPGTGPGFDKTVFLAAGGTLDFGVGYGSNGTYFSDSTGLIADVSVTTPNQPTATLASPPDGITLVAGTDLPLAASVDDPVAILSQVQFLLDGAPVGTATAAPFVFDATVPVSPGAHTVQAVAIDVAGRTSALPATTINVIAATATAVPTSAVLTPLAGHNLAAGSTLTLSIGADADAATTLDHVSLYADGALVTTFNADGSIQAATPGRPTRRDARATGNVFQVPYTLPGADKFVNMIAVAFDKLGQATVSKVASFHSTVTTDKAPVVGLSGLTDGAHVRTGSASTVSVSASDPDATNAAKPGRPVRADATSDMQLALLEYYLSASKVGQAALPPFNFTFTPPAPGKYVLTAVATDGSGLSSISEPITVEADGSALPTVNLAVGGSGAAVEGGANGVIVVSRTGDTSSSLTVFYKTKGAAQAGVDYKTLPGTITIPAGALKAKIKVKPIDGSPNAGTLKLKVQLMPSADGSYSLGTATVKLKLIGH